MNDYATRRDAMPNKADDMLGWTLSRCTCASIAIGSYDNEKRSEWYSSTALRTVINLMSH